eukprot:TRINITY_DN1245_c0_g1_i1.p1 TRINITY_DN1245_c0_g1~~TRINITY_DN1245_c0_g1_i1.p1  ORF type:complete len:84 (+),score=30.14 TRINITY_DN1245_c0_g1_i1:604-855(+)
MRFNGATGEVTDILEGHTAYDLGVRIGWVLIAINNMPYNQDMLSKIDRTKDNTLSFRACNIPIKKKKYRLRGRSSETAKAHRG